ncbi:MAG: TniQ family protein [Acinetobacter populi]|uniref:TniQ family protein n=1 Tax=Acinetobacter populi TaxID=1582270 RepID=UPI0023543F2F|nr:TniQ family protein [Acinetobacter populi]MCH4248513.1 TniQ family protein [Acinetobacter populi]
MNLNPLLIKPIPYSDESAASLLIRAADANGFPNVYSLCHSQSKSYPKALISHVTHQKRFRTLLQLLKLSEDYISLAFLMHGPTQLSPRQYDKIYISNSLFRRDALAFCPKCLAEGSYWRRHWLLRPYTVCLKHHVQLYDHCPKCLKSLGIARNQIHCCNHCGQDLRCVPTQSTDPKHVQWFMAFISSGQHVAFNTFENYWAAYEKFDWQSNAIDIDHQRLKMAYEYMTDLERSKKTLKRIINARISQAHPQIQAVHFRRQNKELKAYIDSVLPTCQKATVPAPEHYQQYFKLADTCAILQISDFRLYNLIDKDILPVEPSEKQFKNISSKNIEQVLLSGVHLEHLKAPQGLCSKENHLLDLHALAYKLNIHKEVARDLGKHGWMKMEIMKVDGCTKMVATIQDFKAFHKKYILVGTLANKLKVNPRNLAEKLKHYGIHPIAGPHIDGTRTSLFHRSDVAHVTTEMITELEYYHTYTGRQSSNRDRMVHYESDPTSYVSLNQAAKKLFISPARVAVLIQKNILKKDVHYHHHIMVENASIHALIQELQRTDFISLQEATERLHCAINWLHINWIKTGYVKLYDYVYWQFVSIQDIEKVQEIQKDYMTAIEASRFLGMHRTHIINLKSQGKIRSISFGVNNSLNMYRREDVIQLLEQQRLQFDLNVIRQRTNQ